MGNNAAEETYENLFIEKTKKFSDEEIALVCNRAALRILPLASMKTTRPVNQLSPEFFVFYLFRALLVSKMLIVASEKTESLKGFAIRAEESVTDLSERLDREFDFAASTDQVHFAGALNMTRITADACLHSLMWAIRMRWFYKIDGIPANYYEISGEKEYFKLVEKDVKCIADMRMSARELYLQPLWDQEYTKYLQERWDVLKEALLKSDENWNGWINWYESVISGAPIKIEQELEIATIMEKHRSGDFHQLNKVISESFKGHNFLNEKNKIKNRLMVIVYSVRQKKSNIESSLKGFLRSALGHLRHMGGGNVIAGIAVVLTIITAILAFI